MVRSVVVFPAALGPKSPEPDVLNYSWRDYGNRVGHWRMMEVMDKYNVRGSISLSVASAPMVMFEVIVSANTDRALEAFQYGVLDFVPKPFTPKALLRAVPATRGKKVMLSGEMQQQ